MPEIHPFILIIDYILGLIMWTLIGRVAMNIFQRENSEFFFMKAFVKLTNPLINLFKQTDYDVVALLMHNESAEHITKFFTQQNLSPAIVGPDALDRKHFALESGHYKGEIYVASPFIFGITNLEAQKFASSFKKKYKMHPENLQEEKYEVKIKVILSK